MIRRGSTIPQGRLSHRLDVEDPHPSTEEGYDRIERPGGATTPKGEEAGIEVHRHSGKAPRRPRNATNS